MYKLLKGVIKIMEIKEKFSNLPIDVLGFEFNVFYVKNDNTFWYEVVATKDAEEYYVCKLDYDKTYQGIKTFLIKALANDLKAKYKGFNIKSFKSSIKLNDKLFTWKKQKENNDYIAIYDLKLEIVQYIVDLKEKNVLVA